MTKTNNNNKNKKGIYDEYLFYQTKYTKLYDNKTIVFMQIGTFHEAYASDTWGYDLDEISDFIESRKVRKNKNKPLSHTNPYMVGFPTVSKHKYLKLLTSGGYTVVIVDQNTFNPSDRNVTGIFTAGTYIDNSDTNDANNIISLYIEDEVQSVNSSILTCVGMSVVDLSTGETFIHEACSLVDDDKYALDEASRFIHNYNPKEIIIYHINSDHQKSLSKDALVLYLEIDNKVFRYRNTINKEYRKISYQDNLLNKIYPDTGLLSPIEHLDLEQKPYATLSFISLVDYAYKQNESIIYNLYKPDIFKNNKHLILGNNSAFQLNVFENSGLDNPNQKIKSLFDVINHTSTPIGRRYLRKILAAPLIDHNKLQLRYNCIEEALQGHLYLKLETHLKNIIDIERLHRKLSLLRIHPYEFVKLIDSYIDTLKLAKLTLKIKTISTLIPSLPNSDKSIFSHLQSFIDECNLIFNYDVMKSFTNTDELESFFKPNVSKKIDQLQFKISNGMIFMENICTVLSTFVDDVGKAKLLDPSHNKIYLKHNNRDGYYLSLTKLRAKSLLRNIRTLESIPINDTLSIKPQDLDFRDLDKGNPKKGNVRIFFHSLSNKSDNLSNLRSKINIMIRDLYESYLKEFHTRYNSVFRKISLFVGIIDFIKSNTKTAKSYYYTKPTIVLKDNHSLPNGFIQCHDLRHPIVERINTTTEYVPHNISLGRNLNLSNLTDGMLIFGTNGCGKSVLMKALGLSIIMAQCGMYVPASSFQFSPYHSLFTRITGNDNLFKGLSSFGLEMTELRAILKRASPHTLVIGDEVCRGTEHLSGNAIVAATLINLAKKGSSFIFATHLHTIANMDRIKALPNIQSFHLSVDYDKHKDSLVFNRLLKPGSGPSVYGITVAKYIIHDTSFIKLAQEIKNELLNVPNNLLSDKTSRYNSDLYMHSCSICGYDIHSSDGGTLDTHHINHQKDCKDGFVISKPYLPMNDKSNLIVLCKQCHHDVHHHKIKINGYKKTSKGRILDFQYLSSPPTPTKSSSTVKRYDQTTIDLIYSFKNQSSQIKTKHLLKDKHNINVSTRTISKIWKNLY